MPDDPTPRRPRPPTDRAKRPAATPDPKTPAERARRIAHGQHGLIAHAQAREAGLTNRQIRYRVRSGRWTEPRPGVYATTGEPEDWEAKVLAVVLAIPGAAASHRTALWLHGVPRLGRPDTIEVTAPLGCRRDLPGVRVHQSRSMPRSDLHVVRGITVTTGARTIIDLAASLDVTTSLAVLDDAICAKIAGRRHLHGRALALCRGRRGVRIVVEATRPGAEREFLSWLERRTAALLEAAGITGRWNVTLRDRRGRIGTVDAVLGAHDLVVLELDGLRFHTTPEQQRRDRSRDRRLLLSGRIPLRFTYADVMERPEQVVADIRQALEAAARRPASHPTAR
jgi:hypothetical protein